jgi:hypothetical protein
MSNSFSNLVDCSSNVASYDTSWFIDLMNSVERVYGIQSDGMDFNAVYQLSYLAKHKERSRYTDRISRGPGCGTGTVPTTARSEA